MEIKNGFGSNQWKIPVDGNHINMEIIFDAFVPLLVPSAMFH